MRRFLMLSGEFVLLGLGIFGAIGAVAMPGFAVWAFFSLGTLLTALRLLSFTFVRPNEPWAKQVDEPQPFHLSAVDYIKALISWLLGFRRTYAVSPGLYYTGDHYDTDAPLLVTANYHLTVFLVTRKVRRANARLLVIDTDGINVWCAAGKGRFGNKEIVKQLNRYPREILTTMRQLQLVLPKFGMSGVDLRALRKEGVNPIIGPLYAKYLPEYLDSRPLGNRALDRVEFNLKSRSFIWLPGFLQLTALSAIAALVLFVLTLFWSTPIQIGIILIIGALSTTYPLLFPLIPGKRFAMKGLVLGVVFSAFFFCYYWFNGTSLASLFFVVPFTIAMGMLTGLEFTGNSAVSNYSRVKREIVSFLPASALLLVVSLGAFFMLEVSK